MKQSKFLFEGVAFDDVVDIRNEDPDANRWSFICEPCRKKHPQLERCVDNAGSPCVCGVEGCANSDDKGVRVSYIDFPN